MGGGKGGWYSFGVEPVILHLRLQIQYLSHHHQEKELLRKCETLLIGDTHNKVGTTKFRKIYFLTFFTIEFLWES